MGETIPGGVYIVNGVKVDANGNPIKEPPKPEPEKDEAEKK